MRYRQIDHIGEVTEGKWNVEGNIYNTPSQTARGVAGGTALNVWIYWYIKRPTDADWILIDQLHREVT